MTWVPCLVVLSLILFGSPPVEAQQAGKLHRVGVLWPGASAPRPSRMEAFREALRESGYVAGRNVIIELRYAEGGRPELSAKRLELLKEILPKVSRVGAIWDPATPSQLKATEEAARSLGVKLQALEVRGANDLAGAFEAAKTGRPEALNALASPPLSALSQGIIDRAAKTRFRRFTSGRSMPRPGA